jgi:GT2 family glycosyltransferase
LNSNRRADTLECLGSLAKGTYRNHKVIVLDNHSTDGSIEAVRVAFPDVEVIELPENLGYAGNNNIGIQAALNRGAEWILVLNEDTIVAPDCLAQLVEVGESDSRNGIIGPMVYHHSEPTVIQSAGGRINRRWEAFHLAQNEADRRQFFAPHAVDWISGCAIAVRRAVIDQVGMIDPRYFYYWEETEWCLRAARAGWRIVHVPAAKIWHKGVQRDYRPKPTVTYYATRNRLLTLSKHHAPLAVWVASWIQILRTMTSWTVRSKWRTMHEHRHAMGRGVVDFLLQRWGGPVQL